MPSFCTWTGCGKLIGCTGSRPCELEAPLYADIKAVMSPAGPNARPIPWVRIHKVPDYVQFPHMRHVTAGVTCQTCHGEVQKMKQVFQYASLNMGWCINCHIERKARYDCSSCHY